MGIGDQIIATGLAKGAKARGKRIALGDGKQIRWDHFSPMIFQGNPNIASPGSERDKDVEWIHYYKGNRWYSKADKNNHKWIFNYDFKVKPGEIFFHNMEVLKKDDDLIIIEPNVPGKSSRFNKRWLPERWKQITDELASHGFKVRQFDYRRSMVNPIDPIYVTETIKTVTFREAIAWLKSARLAILPEGGLHHAAAAVGCPAVVLFGGYVPPAVLGYDAHINLTGGVEEACGNLNLCKHCADAMERITTDVVLDACERMLNA